MGHIPGRLCPDATRISGPVVFLTFGSESRQPLLGSGNPVKSKNPAGSGSAAYVALYKTCPREAGARLDKWPILFNYCFSQLLITRINYCLTLALPPLEGGSKVHPLLIFFSILTVLYINLWIKQCIFFNNHIHKKKLSKDHTWNGRLLSVFLYVGCFDPPPSISTFKSWKMSIA